MKHNSDALIWDKESSALKLQNAYTSRFMSQIFTIFATYLKNRIQWKAQ